MNITTKGEMQRLLGVLGATLLVGIVAPACQGEASPGAVSAPADQEELGRVSSESTVGGCACASKGNCAALSFSDVPSNGTYYITTYGGGSETQPQSCGGQPADGTWAYIADRARFGCGTKVKIEANGKSCITQVADCGPNRCVEEAASGNCGSHFPIIDASPFITKYLYGVSGAGWSDKKQVQASVVSSSATVGCPGSESGSGQGAGGSGQGGSDSGSSGSNQSGGSSQGGSSGAGGSGAQNECSTDNDCSGNHAGAGDGPFAHCDKSSQPWRCAVRKDIGKSCSGDQECNGGITGTQRICQGGVCTDACRQESDCVLPQQCKKAQGAATGHCEGSGCLLQYPSVSIEGVPAPASFSASYRTRGCGRAPSCVIDVNNIIDASTHRRLSYKTVQLSAHFSLQEMTHQSAASSPYVYVDPSFMQHLENTRQGYGSSMRVNSGYRSPTHQNNICHGICGAAFCSGTCARCSDHMGGQAADLQHSSPKCALAKKACSPGSMNLIYNEKAGGDHLHIDIGPGNGTCTYKAISCP